ncbi:hypothetical protein GCM10025794_32810 [Massilia kyonggiensis]
MKLRDALGVRLCAEICNDEFKLGRIGCGECYIRTTIVYTILGRCDQDVNGLLD